MPSVPSVSPATGKQTPPHYIHTTDGQFVDNTGRTLILRGVNLSGSDKAPVGKLSYVLDGFWETAEAGEESFVGRPLNLDDGSADLHLARLRGWGFNLLRYVITWEALEHAGPGKYDYEFMDYTVRVLRKCKSYGFKIYMDPHQDIWSRFSGGSGAPFWTLHACGFDPRHFTATQAAILHCEYPTPDDTDPASLPAMLWSTNYGRLISQTVFTLFFAGRDFAPKCILDGQNIQDYLQSHYIEAFGLLADRIRDAGDLLDECVIGWDSMNEPYEGLCGYPDLNGVPEEQTSTLKKGTFPTPAQSMRMGMGQPQTLSNWIFGAFGPRRSGTVTVDPKGVKAWLDPAAEPDCVHPKWGWKRDPEWKLGQCIWAQHGVWDIESGYVIAPDYFKLSPTDADRDVMFIEDYWLPHWQTFSTRLRRSHPESIMFVAPPVFAQPPPISNTHLSGRCCYSAHYYDGLTLVTRHWNWFNADALGLLRGNYSSKYPAVKLGESAIRTSLQEQLGILQGDASILGPYPTVIGEIGVPYDMDNKRAYSHTDGSRCGRDYTSQQKALDASLNAADGPNALNYTIWTYCTDHSHMWGDGWNMEDLSIWSPDDMRRKEEYRMELGDPSSALLLKKGALVHHTLPAASALSFSSLPVGHDAFEDSNLASLTSLTNWENAYDFLTDGARAVKAFCRPYPTIIIGMPKNIQFDIYKAEFNFTVVVRAEDAPQTQTNTRSPTSSTSSAQCVDGPEEELATEIYVPIVHFASNKVIARAYGQQSETDTLAEHEAEEPHNSKYASSIHSGHVSNTSRSSPRASSPVSVGPMSLALSVQVSDGRWDMEGQTLKWWYPVPAAGAPDREYTIKISRTGGAIKSPESSSCLSRFMEQWCPDSPDVCPSGGCCIA